MPARCQRQATTRVLNVLGDILDNLVLFRLIAFAFLLNDSIVNKAFNNFVNFLLSFPELLSIFKLDGIQHKGLVYFFILDLVWVVEVFSPLEYMTITTLSYHSKS